VATTAELAVLEKFVHAQEDNSPLVLLAIDLPDDPTLGLDVPLVRLPKGWDDMPTSTAAAEFGSAFLKQGTHLYMRVPSTIVQEATNLVINPLHRDYHKVCLEVVRPFSFDPRLFKG
jgi:RES domain-containing protein